MAIYEYHCEECGEDFELWRRISDNNLPVCPKCGGQKVDKLISHSSFVLKGTGWYATDYAHKGASSAGSPANHSGGSSDSGQPGEGGQASDAGEAKKAKGTEAGEGKAKTDAAEGNKIASKKVSNGGGV